MRYHGTNAAVYRSAESNFQENAMHVERPSKTLMRSVRRKQLGTIGSRRGN